MEQLLIILSPEQSGELVRVSLLRHSISECLVTLYPAGGGVLSQIVTLALPPVLAAAQSDNLSVGGVVSQLVAPAGRY